MAVDWAVSTAKKVLDHLGVEAFPRPVADVIEREILPLLEDWRKGVELVYAAIGEGSPVGLSCPTLAEKVLAVRSENERLLHLCNRQQYEIQSLTEMADAVDALRDIGRQTGCDHVDGPDGRRQLVNCVEQTIDALRLDVLKYRKILAYVPARIAIEAKEKAGYPTVIMAMGAEQE